MITAGTAIRESVEIIRAAGAVPAGVLIALDRQERGRGSRSAVQEVEDDLGLKVVSIVSLADVIGYLEADAGKARELAGLRDYRDRYGVSGAISGAGTGENPGT